MTDTTVYDLGHIETQHGTPDPTTLVILIDTADPSYPRLRSLANLALDLERPARAKEWVSGRAYRTGDMAAYDDRVWRCATVLQSSITAPPLSPHWHAVGGWAGNFDDGHVYQAGEYVKWQNDFYMATANVTAGSGSPPDNRSEWAHLAPDLEGFRGIWAAGATYQRGQVVFQSDHFYTCTAEQVSSNTGPVADIGNWDPVGVFRDDWNANYRYAKGDIVHHDGHLWITAATITANQPAPGEAGSTWSRIDNEAFPTVSDGFSGANFQVRFGSATNPTASGVATIPAIQIGSTPEATRGGLMTASLLNRILAALEAVEGRLADAMVWRGSWASGSDYTAGDVVYDSTGQVSHYICTADVDGSTTNPGADQAHWRRLH